MEQQERRSRNYPSATCKTKDGFKQGTLTGKWLNKLWYGYASTYKETYMHVF